MKGCSSILRSSVVKNRMKRMKRIALMILLLTICSGAALAQGGALAAGSGARDPRRESFEIVWSTVKEKHFDPAFGGVDWDAVRRKYEPRVAKVENDFKFYLLLNDMIGELHQSHFGVIPPDALLKDGSLDLPVGSIGIDLRIIDDQAVITRVAPNSTADRAGLRPGFVINRIDDIETAKIRENILERMNKSPLSRDWLPAMKHFFAAQVILYKTGGKLSTKARLQYLDERNQAREAEVEREKPSGELPPRFGNLPAQRTEFEAKRLAGGAGYIRFNAFMMPVVEKVRAALREFHDAPGIIFDLRGNGGGVGMLAPGIAGLMETRQTSLGTSRMRSGQLEFAVFPQAQPYPGPVAVLVDGGSGSTTEIFAAGLQELRRAVIVGERSAGAVLPSAMVKLPTGAIFQYAFADFRTPSGARIEGRGVAPDIEIKHNRAALLSGHDAQLDAAIEAVMKRSQPTAPTVDQILDKYVQAIGGREALEKITSWVIKQTLEISAMGLKAESETYAKAPNKTLTILNISGIGVIREGYDGQTAWSEDPMTGLREKSGVELAATVREADFHGALKIRQRYSKLELKGKEKVGDRETWVILATPAEGAPVKMYYDAQTGLLARTDTEEESPEGKFSVQTTVEDYREVDGVKLPFTSRGKTPIANMVIKTFEVKSNVAIDDAKFKKPAGQ